jgi:hypothetical protein
MEKSIETIWKEGFLKSDILVAPKLNDLYNKKSEHIVDKFTRMFRINLILIVVGSFLVLGMSYLVQIPYMGLGMFVILNILVVINKRLMKGLRKIDKSVNSFQYLKTFDSWMKEQVSINEGFARFLYPVFFLSILSGWWFGEFGGDVPGQTFVNELTLRYPEMLIIFGIPLYGLLGGILAVVLLAYFGGKIYKIDLNIVYGRELKKLNEIIEDMEELRT